MPMATLISLSGVPGVGKTTIARALATRIRGIHLRVDSVEAALKNSLLKIHPAEDAGYLALAAIAKDNLALGLDVIADTVNPVEVSRQLWFETATAARALLLNVEIMCSDERLHRQRVERRTSDIEGLVVPDWERVTARYFEPWSKERLVLDTALLTTEDCILEISAALNHLK